MAEPPLRVLLVEDNPTDALLLREALAQAPLAHFEVTPVERLAEAVAWLKQAAFNVVLLDLGLPDSQGLPTFLKLHGQAPGIPIVVVSGLADEALSLQAVQAGAQDYLVKGPANGPELGRVIRYAVERKRAEAALRESEARYRSLFQNNHSVMLLIDPESGDIVNANPTACVFYGYTREEITRLKITDINQFTPEQVFAEMERAKQEQRRQFFFRHRLAGGEVREVEVYSGPIEFAGKNLLYSIVHDITERREAEAALRLSEERFAKAFQASPTGIALSRLADGQIMEVNDRWQDMFGYSRAEAVGQSSLALNIYADPADRQRFVAQIQAQGFVRDFELKYRRKSGEEGQASLAAELLDINHETCLLTIVMDITERKRAEEAIRQLNQELEQRVRERTAQLEATNRELEAFAYSVSHDLRTPLRGIDGFSQALLEDYAERLDGPGQKYLQRVRAASQRMGQLIDDLLALSRLTRSEMRREPVNLSELVQAIAADLRQMSAASDAEPARPTSAVEFVIAAGIVAQVDAQLIRVALENLLGNAWKFTARHPTARIEFGLLQEPGGQPVYFVRDDGAGFDMAYADKLFGAFQRLHTPAEFAGTGIGLATVQRIIHRHGGRIWAEGAVEQGATFYFTL